MLSLLHIHLFSYMYFLWEGLRGSSFRTQKSQLL